MVIFIMNWSADNFPDQYNNCSVCKIWENRMLSQSLRPQSDAFRFLVVFQKHIVQTSKLLSLVLFRTRKPSNNHIKKTLKAWNVRSDLSDIKTVELLFGNRLINDNWLKKKVLIVYTVG